MKKTAKILEELLTMDGGEAGGKMYAIKRSPRKHWVKLAGPDGSGVVIREDVLKDLCDVSGVPDIEDHPRGILFYWAVEHAPKQTLQSIADATMALTCEQAKVLYELTIGAKNGGLDEWKKGWRNALYYGLANAPGG